MDQEHIWAVVALSLVAGGEEADGGGEDRLWEVWCPRDGFLSSAFCPAGKVRKRKNAEVTCHFLPLGSPQDGRHVDRREEQDLL